GVGDAVRRQEPAAQETATPSLTGPRAVLRSDGANNGRAILPRRSRAEQPLHQLLAGEVEVSCHVPEDAAERTNTERVVIRHRDVVLTLRGRREPEMAPGLPRDAVAESLERLRQIAPREVPRELQAEI